MSTENNTNGTNHPPGDSPSNTNAGRGNWHALKRAIQERQRQESQGIGSPASAASAGPAVRVTRNQPRYTPEQVQVAREQLERGGSGGTAGIIRNLDILGCGSLADIPILKNHLWVGDAAIRLAACKSLQQIGVATADIQQIYVNERNSKFKREMALVTLRDLQCQPRLPEDRAAILMMTDPYPGLQELGASVVDALLRLLEYERVTRVLSKAVEELAQHDDPRIAPALIGLLERQLLLKQMDVPLSVIAQSLERLGDRRAVGILKQVVSTRNQSGVDDAIKALVKLGDASVIPALMESSRLSRQVGYFNTSAIGEGISHFGKNAAEYLVAYLNDECEQVRSLAIRHLRQLQWTPQTTEQQILLSSGYPVQLLSRQLRSATANDRRKAAQLLGEAGHPLLNDELEPLLSDPERSVREAAGMALKKLGWSPRGAKQETAFYAATHDWSGLAKLRSPQAVESLVDFVRHCDPYRFLDSYRDDTIEQKRLAQEALGSIPGEATTMAIASLASSTGCLSWVMDELRRRGPQAEPAWMQLLAFTGYNQDDVRRDAAIQLIRLGSARGIIAALSVLPELGEYHRNDLLQAFPVPPTDHPDRAVRKAIKQIVDQLFARLNKGYLEGPMLKALGADERQIVQGYLELLEKYDRPSNYHLILDFFIAAKSSSAVPRLLQMVRIPKPGDKSFYKSIVLTIGKIGDRSAIGPLRSLLYAQWEVTGIGRREIVDSSWIRDELLEAIRMLEIDP